MVYLFVVIQIYNKFSGFLLFFTIIYNLSLEMSDEPTITFLRASGPGDTLFAEARERYIGRSTGCYQVDITNQDGELIATFESSVFRKDQKVPFEVQE